MFNAPSALLVARTLTDAPGRRTEPRRPPASWRPASARLRTALRPRAVAAIGIAGAQRT
jgi:hypothetical protein